MAENGSGLDLARALYTEVIEPMVSVPHAACLIGEGSDVLGYDTERSTDHEWGPRLQLFVAEASVEATRQVITERLPDVFHGHPTRWFSLAAGQVTHHVEIDTAEAWLNRHLRTLPADPDVADWLAAPQQHLLQLTSGEVFHDDIGVLSHRRETYARYPDDVWRWMVASQWHLIGNVEPLLGRTIETDDTRGSQLLTARLCRLAMEMAHLQHRSYWPYPKWFGAAFAELPVAAVLGPLLDAAMAERPAIRRDGPLQHALLLLAENHNHLRLSDPVDAVITDFAVGINDAVRPFPVLNTAQFIEATVQSVIDPALRSLPRVGSVDQLTHADDQLINFTAWPGALAAAYRQMLSPA